jgi:uncharacterized cupin superfamily protein
MSVVHWDDVEAVDVSVGEIGGLRQALGDAVGTTGFGVNRMRLAPGHRTAAVHTHGQSEEIFYVLAGDGLLWQNGATAPIAAGDCVVQPRRVNAHVLVAGDGGLDVLLLGTRHDTEFGVLPRAGVVRLGPATIEVAEGPHAWQRDLDAGPLDLPAPGPRPANVVSLDDAESDFGGAVRRLAASAGARRTGLNHVTLPPGRSGAPAHCHSLEEELFLVIDGTATLLLHPRGGEGDPERHELRAGHVVGRPPGTGVAHELVAGPEGVTYLAYGTREPNDMTFYPAERRVSLRGLGVSFELP